MPAGLVGLDELEDHGEHGGGAAAAAAAMMMTWAEFWASLGPVQRILLVVRFGCRA